MARTFYAEDILTFLRKSDVEIFGQIAANDEYDSVAKQKNAWLEQIRILKHNLSSLTSGSVIFEYTLPRVGGRIDNVLLIGNTVFVFEFKIGAQYYDNAATTQVRTYALDLSNFHEQSRNKKIVPVLIATMAQSCTHNKKLYRDNVYDIVYSNGENLEQIIKDYIDTPSDSIDMQHWLNSRYVPTPTIIQAAEILYSNHSVEEITQNQAAENLSKTTAAVQNIITNAQKKGEKSICFITGVPGAGKTLAGLNIAIENQKATGHNYSCFLTGNQPLVDVLREALAKNDHERNNTPISEARDKVKSFIQIIHHFRDASLDNTNVAPVDNVIIFDEAQRAWHQNMLYSFMQKKKLKVLNRLDDTTRTRILGMSEPEILIEYMNRHTDWAVIVCLVGGGQDINTGEAGIQEWFRAIKKSFPNWNVFVSDKIRSAEYIDDKSFRALVTNINYQIIPELHLSVSLRSFRSEYTSDFVTALLDNDINAARDYYEKLRSIYPIYITRNLNSAKKWVRSQTHGTSKRHGLIASSNAKRLRPEGIWVEAKCTPEKWFLEGPDNIKSSFFMEETATEFDIQGLEIDFAVVGWDADYRYENGKFEYYRPKGSRWLRITQEEKRRHLKNAYRVLLTRAREGFIIFVPNGNNEDTTRKCKFYDELWDYLTNIGIEVFDQ